MKVRQEELSAMVKAALSLLYCNERWLIDHHCHEVNIVGAFYYYFRSAFGMRFPGYAIDMEYSRQGKGLDPKRVSAGDGDCIRSDFVIHKRGTKDNVLAIEFKTEWSEEDFSRDAEKLQAMTRNDGDCLDFANGYQHGLSLVLAGNGAMLAWYRDGAPVNEERWIAGRS